MGPYIRPAAIPAFLLLLGLPLVAAAQCGAGESEVRIRVTTDGYGYEAYWELLPNGASCGAGAIFSGGNPLVGCNGAGAQAQQPGGYGNNLVIEEGPWCLPTGGVFDIFWADDWGDGGLAFEVLVDGVPAAQFQGGNGAPAEVYTFVVQPAPPYDVQLVRDNTPRFVPEGEQLLMTGTLRNTGGQTITDVQLIYAVDGGAPVVADLTMNLAPGAKQAFSHPVPWYATGIGTHQVLLHPGLVNGSADGNGYNDTLVFSTKVHAPTPNIIDQYLSGQPVVNVVADSDQDLLVPRDLDFHPDPDRNELWVINKDVEATGGSTVTFFGPGDPDMTYMWKRDPNAWHFMSLPTAIAMGDNGFFATSPGVFDANHNGGTPFTGPTLWSADTAIYAATTYGPLGSHFDMLHVNPNSQGIAHERWNRYWVVDGFNGDIVMNDFMIDHGPGNDYHGNAIIRRYADFTITKDPNDHIVSHAVMDRSTGWLYVVDHGGQRVLRLDTQGGTVSGPGNYGPWESYAEYSMVTGYAWDEVVTTGLVEPAGIDLVGDRLLVSDHANGDIVVYDLNAVPATELGRIHTGASGLMGIKVGPDGRVWGVNATYHQLIRIDPGLATGIATVEQGSPSAYPSPTDGPLWLTGWPVASGPVQVLDISGRAVMELMYTGSGHALDVSPLPPGVYMLQLVGSPSGVRFIKQ